MGTEKINCIIVSGAPDNDIDYLKERLNASSYIIAADSGYLNCIACGITPDMIIGDFDSAQKPDIDCKIITLPTGKDDTDTFYCVKKAVEMGFIEIEILCGIGDRADHNYSNILCLYYCYQNNIKCTISNRKNKIQLIDSSITINNDYYKYFSIFSLFENCVGVTEKGSYYELDNATLTPYQQIGQSNCFKNNNEVTISLKKGIILLIQSND